MIVIGEAPLGRGCALACARCSSAGSAAASAAPVRRTLRRSISLSSAVGWLTISPSIAHWSHALSSLKIEAWLWPPVKETATRSRHSLVVSLFQTLNERETQCRLPHGKHLSPISSRPSGLGLGGLSEIWWSCFYQG